MCVTPIVYQTTTSWFDSDSLFATHFGSPSPPRLWLGYAPAAYISSAW